MPVWTCTNALRRGALSRISVTSGAYWSSNTRPTRSALLKMYASSSDTYRKLTLIGIARSLKQPSIVSIHSWQFWA
jgi:hypothetical protein